MVLPTSGRSVSPLQVYLVCDLSTASTLTVLCDWDPVLSITSLTKKTRIIKCALPSDKCSFNLPKALVCSICCYGMKKNVKGLHYLLAIFHSKKGFTGTFLNPYLAAITGSREPSLMHRHLELPSAASCQKLLHALSKWVYYFERTSLNSLTGDMAWTLSVARSRQILEKTKIFLKVSSSAK